MGSDRSFTSGICLLEPWVTAADPRVGPKLEPDSVARWEAAGPALPFHWPVASPGLVGLGCPTLLGPRGPLVVPPCPLRVSILQEVPEPSSSCSHCAGSLGWGRAAGVWPCMACWGLQDVLFRSQCPEFTSLHFENQLPSALGLTSLPLVSGGQSLWGAGSGVRSSQRCQPCWGTPMWSGDLCTPVCQGVFCPPLSGDTPGCKLHTLGLLTFPTAREPAPGQQVQRGCSEAGGLWPGHRGAGGPAGMVW